MDVTRERERELKNGEMFFKRTYLTECENEGGETKWASPCDFVRETKRGERRIEESGIKRAIEGERGTDNRSCRKL